MEQQTGFKQEKEYVKAVYGHPAYLNYVQSILCEMPGWMNESKFTHSFIHSYLESKLPGEVPTTSDMQMIPL